MTNGGRDGVVSGRFSSRRVEGTNNLFNTFRRTHSRGHWISVKRSAFFYPPSIVWSSGTHIPGGSWRKIKIKIE